MTTSPLLLPAKGKGTEGGVLGNSQRQPKNVSAGAEDFEKLMTEAQAGLATATTGTAAPPAGATAAPTKAIPPDPTANIDSTNPVTLGILLVLLGKLPPPEITPSGIAASGEQSAGLVLSLAENGSKGDASEHAPLQDATGLHELVTGSELKSSTKSQEGSAPASSALPIPSELKPTTEHVPSPAGKPIEFPHSPATGVPPTPPANIATLEGAPTPTAPDAGEPGKNSPPGVVPIPMNSPPQASGDGAPPSASGAAETGTTVAINGQPVKSASKKNEIAGSAAQKLPQGHESASGSNGSVSNEAPPPARAHEDFSSFKDSPAQWTFIDTHASSAASPTLTTNTADGIASSSSRQDQVERLITREVVMVRQSGAEALAVSLKVDSQTSLFLQLTNHHGQIEASVRCESGDAGALNAHWSQLRESLSLQNVQLLPLEGSGSASSNSHDTPSQASGDSQEEPKPNQPPTAPEAEKPSDDAMNAAVGLSKSKSRSRRSHGWEKWA